MTGIMNGNYRRILFVLLIAALLVVAWNWAQIDYPLTLDDEGYLWYGVWRTSVGEVPNRDFQSYLPGRFYWSALWASLFGEGVIAMRLSCAIFQFVALVFGLLVLKRMKAPLWYLAVAGSILLVWFYPNYKSFDSGIALAGVYFAALIMENPSSQRHFAGGVFTGIAACFGLHHGLYTSTGFMFVIMTAWVMVSRKDLLKRAVCWLGGSAIGFMPIVFMWVFVPGYFNSFAERVRYFMHLGVKTLSLPIPWPWRVLREIDPRAAILGTVLSREFIGGVILIVWIALIVFAIIALIKKRDGVKNNYALAVLTSAAVLSIPRLNHYFSRADLEHLANSILPVFMGVLSIPFLLKKEHQRKASILALALLVALSYPVIRGSRPYHRITGGNRGFVKEKIGNDTIFMARREMWLIGVLRSIQRDYMMPDENILTVPYFPGVYPVIDQTSPLREIFFILPETAARQDEMIEELKQNNTNWVIVGDIPMDGIEERRFRYTHSVLWKHLNESFEKVPIDLYSEFTLFHRKAVGDRRRAVFLE